MGKFDPQTHHRHSIRLKGFDYAQAGGYFVTIVAWQRKCLFGKIRDHEMKVNRYGEIVQKWWKEIPIHFPGMETGAFVIMPNHVHGIILIEERRGTVLVLNDNVDPQIQGGETPPLRVPTLGQIVAYFKYQSTKEMNLLDNTGVITNFGSAIITNMSSETKTICRTKRITFKRIRFCGMRITKIRSL